MPPGPTSSPGSPPRASRRSAGSVNSPLHRESADQHEECVVASLAAADAAHQLRMWRAEEAHLQRALRLWPNVDSHPTVGHDLVALHERAFRAGHYTGHTDDAVRHLDQALRFAEATGDVLRASYYRIEVQARTGCGRGPRRGGGGPSHRGAHRGVSRQW